jgi:hypothetical protein
MKTMDAHDPRQLDAFGRRIAVRLSAGAGVLPHDIGERLRAAREQALARRRATASKPLRQPAWSGHWGGVGLGQRTLGWWGRVAAGVPIVVLVAGLVAINVLQSDYQAQQIAEVDAALLTDDLPPDAYTDPGFLAFLRREQ